MRGWGFLAEQVTGPRPSGKERGSVALDLYQVGQVLQVCA